MIAPSQDSVCVAIDCMGGDAAPRVVFEGIALCAHELGKVALQLCGDPACIEPFFQETREKTRAYPVTLEVIPAEDVIPSDMKPAVAVRSHRNSSLGVAVRSVREHQAHAVLSAGNTGALMALSKVMLGMLEGIDRPAIATFLPTMRGQSLVLDLGANAECSARNLVDFCFLGEALAQIVLGVPSPSVGLLNIGSEETKGNHTVQEAADILKHARILKNYAGFLEGTDICAGTADVVVTDGFTGNVVLKTIEGSIHFVKDRIKGAIRPSAGMWLSALLLRRSMKKIFANLDPRIYNGAVLLGLDALAVKSHGGADDFAFAQALKFTVNVARQNLIGRVKGSLDKLSSLEENTTL
ncbi:MAG: phosphate acyltransferase PlsX [Holosporales bacterium]|jgi:glycerol-3-phosphate acyltransferase PlsX|nr:phosphate acyltransferase PlsX [Holosporales bacterium]